MTRPIRTTAVVLCVLAAACGADQKMVRRAQTSGYDADFAIVFSEALAAVQELYPHLDENPSAGWIKTAWHPVRVNQQEGANDTTNVVGAGTGTSGGAFQNQQQTLRKYYFVRFRIYVLGGRPWRIRVEGEASEFETGNAKPVPLRGAAVPGWLKGRTESLQVAIYERLSRHAVPLEKKHIREHEPRQERELAADAFGDLPAGATEHLDAVRGALQAGNYDALRALIADDTAWSPGAPPSGDQAIVMWKADPTLGSRLVQVIEAGCAADGKVITCPAGYNADRADNPLEGFHARFEKRNDTWLLTSFYQGE